MSEDTEAPTAEAPTPPVKVPRLTRNYISFAGMAIAAAGFISIVLMVLFELTGAEDHNPYIGIFTYIIFPSVMVFGLFLIVAGMIWERRRRRRHSPEEIAAFPILDLNNPRRRRSFITFLVFMFIFLFMSALGSYRAFEHTESVQFCGQTCHEVMKPEFVAYQASPHARVKCVECHVGPGADWYVRSKLSGAYQLYSVAFNKFSRPITTPVHNLRPAQQTCEQCHWPEKFWGAQLKTFDRYAYDEGNTLRQTRMLINTGGGNPKAGAVAGIHWHMNIANEITYYSTDEQRQSIPWVKMKDRDGNETVYYAKNARPSEEEIARQPKRQMDCVDCHNRPSHVYQPPDRAVNQSFSAGRLDASLPFLKREAVAVLTKPYATTPEAVDKIASSLDNFYRTQYADVYASKPDAVRDAITEVQRIYQTYIFPEMKTDWRTHPDNLSHFYFQGCFRCHDGQHASDTGRIIRNDCNICHTVLDQTEGPKSIPVTNGSFTHPIKLGDLGDMKCVECHRENAPFRHPLNLGDISQFACTDCHK